ncbi:hypothetical protein HYS93_01150 [Candidatus Daviesbacteria bacterium]|nr:hypothetical protein [Candidatus Daviesbacteria bacterium]
MRKVISIVSSAALVYALTISTAFAQGAPVNVNIPPPGAGVSPSANIGKVLANAFTIIVFIAALSVLVMLIWGAFQWIVSGGDKENVAKARGRILAALIGLAVLAVAFLIARVVGQLSGVNITQFNLPWLGQ